MSSIKITKKIRAKYTKVQSVKHLRALIDFGYCDYAIQLNHGVISRKFISRAMSNEKNFCIINWIDGSEQTLTEKRLMSQSWTNIGVAIEKKALWCSTEERYDTVKKI